MSQNYTKISKDKIIVQNFILQVDAEVGALVLVADALLLGMAVVTARARIHRSHQHERSRIFGRIFRPTDTYYPVLQRLAHHLQDRAIEFRQLIQAEELAPLFNDFMVLTN